MLNADPDGGSITKKQNLGIGSVDDDAKRIFETGSSEIIKKQTLTAEPVTGLAKTILDLGEAGVKTVQTITDLVMGSKDPEAEETVNLQDKRTVTVSAKVKEDPNSSEAGKKILGAKDKQITATVNLVAGAVGNFAQKIGEGISNALGGLKKLFGLATGGIVTSGGRLHRFASGGMIMRNGRASWWDSVNKYASGTSRAHGTLFVAGENGPEVMGHVNGRTEILNKSQIAEAIHGAVLSGMSQAVNALGRYLAGHMSNCTNAIVTTIGATAGLFGTGSFNYYTPAMVDGGVMPYDVSAQIARSTQDLQNTLDANNEDLIQAMVSAIGNAASSIINAFQFQGARSGFSGLTAQQVINEINRQTLMNGTSPLKGV